jgi:hypothetical protein
MKKAFGKTLFACLMTGALTMASAGASAAIFADFIVNEGSVNKAKEHLVSADKITGNYNEVITFNRDNTFNVSLLWQAGQFVGDNGAHPVASQLGSLSKEQYQLYALFQGSGTVSTSGGVSTFSFIPAGSLQVFIDPNSNTKFTEPLTGSTTFKRTANGDDYLIATGVPTFGKGTLDPSLSTCGGDQGINCGSFGSSTTFELTDAGKEYFISPNPFYNVSFQSGQLNNFQVLGTQSINGSLDVVFNSTVPEPSTVALAGLGLIGLAFSRRRQAVKS